MKILYLLPPSEGKNSIPSKLPLSRGGTCEILSFPFEKPTEIAIHATQKDLKCTGKRYEEGIELNISLLNSLCLASTSKLSLRSISHFSSKERAAAASSSPGGEELRGAYLPAISRYSGVMYGAIHYEGMSVLGKKYFDENFLILSGMYGLLRPQDMIGNYKLPIETKGLVQFWDDTITHAINSLDADIIVDLLPLSYKKMIQWKNIDTKILKVEFMQVKNGQRKKMTHGVKKVKGEWIHALCEKGGIEIPDFGDTKDKILEIEV